MKMPGFRLPKNQQFGYKPRYWDPKEEERKERQERMKTLSEGGVDAMKSRISGTFSRNKGSSLKGTYRNRQVAKSNIVLVVVIAGLVLASYYLIMVYLPRLEEMLG